MCSAIWPARSNGMLYPRWGLITHRMLTSYSYIIAEKDANSRIALTRAYRALPKADNLARVSKAEFAEKR